MKDKSSRYAVSMQVTRLGRSVDEQCGLVNTPIYRGSTVIFKTVDDLENHRSKRFSG